MKFSEIRNILLNPTKDGLIKILSITSLSDFDRVRGQFQKLKYEGYRLTLDVADIIEKRTKELFNNKIKSDVLIEEIHEDTNQKRVDELERQLEEMKAMLAQVVGANSVSNVPDESDKKEDTVSNDTVKRGPGRPKKVSE